MPRVKYAVIYRHREEYPVSVMCNFFDVSRSGYYDFVKRLGKPEKDAVWLSRSGYVRVPPTRPTATDGCGYGWNIGIYTGIQNCSTNNEKVWSVVRNPSSEEVDKPRSTDA